MAKARNKLNIPNNKVDKKPTGRAAAQKNHIEFAEVSVAGSSFNNIKTKGFKSTKLNQDIINKYLLNPQRNYENLQNTSNLFYSTSGVYGSLVDYYSSLPKYYYTIIPSSSPIMLMENKSNKEQLAKDLYEAALRAQKLKIRENCYRFAKDLWLDGECYYYKIEDSKGIIYQKIPNEYCMPYSVENDVIRFAVDMSKISSDDKLLYPLEIQKVIELYKTNPKSNEFIDGYYPIKKDGVCFSTVLGGHGIPPLSKILGNIINLDEKRALQDNSDILNSAKMIHNQIPTDKDGKVTQDIKVAQKYNQAIKTNLIEKGLEEGVFSMTNPFESKILDLSSNTSKNIMSLAKRATEEVYDEMGVSEMLFNSSKGGTEALKKSVIADSARILVLSLNMFQSYFTNELQLAKGKIKYAVKMLENTWFNEAEKIKESKEELAYGGSVKVHYANLGYTPLEMINLIAEENILGFKELLTPIQTSHTQSSKDNAGRPSSEEMKENGEEVSDVTDRKEESGVE